MQMLSNQHFFSPKSAMLIHLVLHLKKIPVIDTDMCVLHLSIMQFYIWQFNADVYLKVFKIIPV